MVKAPPDAPMPYRNEGGYTRFLDPDQYPCQAPPWGELSAVNANTGDIVWRRPLGSYDELEAQGLKDTGASNMGGSIVTAGGLVFIAATTDGKFRAFDSRTGKELWMTRLDATGDTVPMTFLGRNGRQYVVLSAGGSNRFRMIANSADKTSDSLIAFSLAGADEKVPQLQSERSSPPHLANVDQPARSTTIRRDLSAPGAPLPDAPEKALVVRVCTKCHGAGVFSSMRMSRKAWQNEVAAMVEKGATGTPAEMQAVTDYLARNFGSDAK